MAHSTNLDTRKFDPSKRLDAWNNCVSESFAACVVDARKDFIACYDVIKFDHCKLARVQGDAAKIEILANQTKSLQHNFALLAHHNGHARYQIAGQQFDVGHDEFVFVDMNEKFSVDVKTDNKDIHKLIIPNNTLNNLKFDPAAFNGVRFSRNHGAGVLLNSVWDTVWRNGEQLASNSDSVLLQAFSLLLDTANSKQPRLKNEHLVRIINFIKQHLTDENLSTATIGTTLGLSERCVQLAFAELGTTPSRYIRQLRLELAAQKLQQRHAKISQIAYDVGFSDISLFNRQFKAVFQMSPSNYRKCHQ